MKKIMVLAVALIFTLPACAGYYKGTDLQKWSEASERIIQGRETGRDFQDSATLSGYIAASTDIMDSLQFICIPDGTTLKQLHAILAKYLKENPETWGRNANDLIYLAYSRPFPCDKKK